MSNGLGGRSVGTVPARRGWSKVETLHPRYSPEIACFDCRAAGRIVCACPRAADDRKRADDDEAEGLYDHPWNAADGWNEGRGT